MAGPNYMKTATSFLKRINILKNTSSIHLIPSCFHFSPLPLSPQNAWLAFQLLVQTVGVGNDVGRKREP